MSAASGNGVRPVVVFAIGNPSRGDDAIGPLIYARLTAWLDAQGLAESFDLYEDFQLQIEHAIDLKGRQMALFIDAGDNTPGPFTFSRIAPHEGIAHTSHALPPESVLQVYRQIEGEEPPPAFVLCVRGEQFGLGKPPGAAAESHIEQAWAFLAEICHPPELAVWMKAAAVA
ncbi:MAG: hydrogenase maturation protease [Rhodocyclales bacterium GT-UBC]|nr:MAG: hydrogenase maturation protease [Rhodocyclales bacterium GT-UBC]